MPVRAEAWRISKKPPVAVLCMGDDGPKPDRLREDRGHLILLQPEDHRRAVPRCSADWGPTLSYGLSRHSRFKPARIPSGEPSWGRPQREPDRHLHSSQQVRTNQRGGHLFAGLKQPCQKLRLLSWQRFLVPALRPKPEGAILVEPDVSQARRISLPTQRSTLYPLP
jgi:hypothetical protein